MSSFIAPSTSSPPAPSSNLVENDGFFPDIELTAVRESMRLDGTVTHTRLRDAVVAAVIEVNTELAAWKVVRIAAGAPTLDQDGPQIGGVSIKSTQYRIAVYRSAKADLAERYQDFDSTKTSVEAAEKRAAMVDDDRRAVRWAIRDLLGQPRTTIELI